MCQPVKLQFTFMSVKIFITPVKALNLNLSSGYIMWHHQLLHVVKKWSNQNSTWDHHVLGGPLTTKTWKSCVLRKHKCQVSFDRLVDQETFLLICKINNGIWLTLIWKKKDLGGGLPSAVHFSVTLSPSIMGGCDIIWRVTCSDGSVNMKYYSKTPPTDE